ncbi:MAG TPA: metallopeptidase TldD-related protein [Bryobacteraceae bacterium]|nr:metallopeptidase TldD-related protein [Bryobacteraceae bacterium]
MHLKFLIAIAFALAIARGQSSPLLDLLNEELTRNFEGLKKADPAPYFIDYSVVEQQAEIIAASRGAILQRGRGNSRTLDVTVRVGSPELDSYHIQGGESPRFTSAALISLEDVPNSIKRKVWQETDRVYKLASQRLINLKTSTKVKVEASDRSEDFSKEEPSVYVEPVKKLSPVSEEWVDRARRWSAELAKHNGVLSSNISLIFQRETKYLVNTEGTRIQHGRGFVRIIMGAQGKASDGMDLSTYDSFEAEDIEGLPSEAAILAAVNKVGTDLTKLLDAPVVDPFVGPAILSGRASGVFFHEIFGHRIEGHRQRDETDGQTFTKSVNTRILPDFISVVFDPTLKTIGSVDLNGSYRYDDEGVKARRVPLVEGGVLKTFLMSRSPIEGFPSSNGHGRRQAGMEIVSRQSNLLVESSKRVSDAELRKLLIEEIKKQGKQYGFFFQNITGGFTFTGRRGLQAFKVLPLVVYRVYADGRPDELVRGVDIVGTPLASFARIVATSDKTEVFNGYCGAESGNVPVSAVSPAILVSEIEIQKKEKGNDRPPLLLPPSAAGGL